MQFNRHSVAALAAAALLSFAGFQGSGSPLRAAEAAPLPTPSPAAPLTDEVVPVFVPKEVVQPLPASSVPAPAPSPADEVAARPVPQSAETLSALVAATDTSGAMDAELRCLAGAIYFEARGEPLEGQLAVAQVIVNRSESGRFPKTYCGVVTQRGQFSFVKGGRMPQAPVGSAAWRRAHAVARIAHEGRWDSKAGESLFFHATHVSPGWRGQRVATISRHVFYK